MSMIKRNIISFLGLLCLVFWLFSGINAIAQTQKFQKVYGGYSYDYGNDLVQTPDSGYLLLCTSNSFSANSDIYLLKVDKLGNYQWQHTYGGTEIEGACKIKFTQDGNIAMAGHSSSYLYNSYDFYLVKANMNGDTIWTKHYGSQEWDFANSMDTCADGGFIMAGKTYDTNNEFSDILIIKTDADGNEQWQKKIGGIKDDVANAIISIPDGYLICGTTGTGIYGGSDIYVFKIDLSGNLVWENYDGEQFDDEGTGVYFSSENDIVIAGKRRTLANPNNFNTNIRKLSQNGSFFWNNPYITSGGINIQINAIIEGYNKKITTIGSFDGNSLGIDDMVMFMWDSMGYYSNSGTYGGSLNDYGENVIKTLDNGYAMIGSTLSFGGTGLSKIIFVKTDTILPSNAPLTLAIGINEKARFDDYEIKVFPNPFVDETKIQIQYPQNELKNQLIELKLTDQLGADVSHKVDFKSSKTSNGIEFTIVNLNLKSGMYFYKIISKERNIAQGKITIMKE
jgi:hypothetical protein